MANSTPNTETARWTSALENHRIANLAWSIVDLEEACPAREGVAQSLAEARSLLFSTPAPDIGAVIEKLTLWWGEELLDGSYESSQNRTVIGDLRRIEKLNAGMTELEASGRSPEEAAMVLREWRAALAEHSELVGLLVEARDDVTWEEIAEAEGELLELPAPNLAGVIRKLELLWEVDRFDSIEAGVFYVQLILDLNRLSRSSEHAPRELH